MLCEICGGKTEPTVLLPIKQNDGKLDTIACLACAEASGAYCKTHETPHIGFPDKTTACRRCIEDVVAENLSRAGTLVVTLLGIARDEEYERLVENALISSFVTGNSEEISILRYLATKAARMQVSLDDVMLLIETTKSVSHIIEWDPTRPAG